MKHYLKYLVLTLALSLAMVSCDTPEKRYERARTLYEEGTELRGQRLSEEAAERFLQALNIQHGGGYNLVSKDKRPTQPGRIWQHECDGWYIYSNISNGTKAEDLKP